MAGLFGFQKSLVIKNPFYCSYNYSYNPEHEHTHEEQTIQPTTPVYINAEYTRSQGLNFGPSISLSLRHMFFADSSLKMTLSSPFFHEPKHTKYGTIFPGSFDVGQWFRPINIELQMWKKVWHCAGLGVIWSNFVLVELEKNKLFMVNQNMVDTQLTPAPVFAPPYSNEPRSTDFLPLSTI